MRTASPSLGRKRRREAWRRKRTMESWASRVLEGEVAVAAGGGAPVGDFAFDGDVAVGALDEVADVADEVAYGEDLRGGREVLRGRRGFGAAVWRTVVARERDCSARMSAAVTVGGGVEEGGLGGGGGAWGGFAGAGAAEVGEAGDVVWHRKTSLVVLRGSAGAERIFGASTLRRFGGGTGLRGGGVRGGRVC